MKKKLSLLGCLALLFLSSFAQNDDPVAPMSKIDEQMTAISSRYVVYQSVMAHSDNPRKAEKRREDLMNQITVARQSMAEIPYYKGDKSLHQATNEYLKLMEHNLNEDYSKMVNMREIAEQSYDKMEAYILLKEKVDEKMDLASDKLDSAQINYCKKYNIKLVESGKTELDRQLEKIGAVSRYADKMYLVFFKCNILEQDLLEAIKGKNVNKIEQLRGSLKSFAEEGLATLDTSKPFSGDNTMISATKRSMNYYLKEAEKCADYSAFYTKEANFTRLKQQFDSDRDMRKDKAAVDKYNAAVNEMNDALKQYNNTNEYLNKYRSETIDFWNNASKQFYDRHIPVAD